MLISLTELFDSVVTTMQDVAPMDLIFLKTNLRPRPDAEVDYESLIEIMRIAWAAAACSQLPSRRNAAQRVTEPRKH
jgi:hypothetical protein